ncbi:hypothetical protein Goari_022102, partial [Gossypium aridum]|nr:hypothetical protein [Gossypium aridum]
MNVDLNTFVEVPLDQLIASPNLPNESYLNGWSSDLNLKQLEEMLLKDEVYMTQLIYLDHKVNLVETNQFNSHIGSSLPKDGVYTAQSPYSERRVNLVKANNLNSHIGSSLPEDGVYTAKPTRVGLLHGRSTQVNRQAPTWNLYKANDFYRPRAPS